MSKEFPSLREVFTVTAQDREECRFFAEEPVCDDQGYIGPPSRFQVFMSKRLPLVTILAHRFAWFAGSLRCRMSTHDWVDESYGGPESGCMAGHCKRCGFSFHTTLY